MENCGIEFIDSTCAANLQGERESDVLHLLCTAGSMSFAFQEVRYNIMPRDYVIMPNASLASAFSQSGDFDAIVMRLSEAFVASLAIRSNYGIIGHLFRNEMLGSLLTAHILDLYDIHARENETLTQAPERAMELLRRFVGMLYDGEYREHRDLAYYASRLCITPHYLSEVCRDTCGRPATYWIDRFTMQEITRLLACKELPLAGIAERLNFSSLSYFSRYVQKRLGTSPSTYRSNIGK